ncbi:MAG TPA: NAD(P)/FAD-dependent oxidoreductase [Candidatus Acidoferrales bacterium]|nr:NAD(P)/FAD-dependent oxidoreductase [Candidatus Acidoferrales bacterium]
MTTITRRGFVKGAALAPFALSPLPAIAQAPAAQAVKTDRFDIVVAGAGHNSLIATAYLAKAGYRCLVLEVRPVVGGGVMTQEVTLPGFKHDTCSTAHSAIQGNPLLRNNELNLSDYGLEYIDPDPIMHMPFADGTYITQWRDVDRTCAEFAKFSKKDASAYRRMMNEYASVSSILNAVTFTPIGFGKSLNERLAAHPQGKIWQRRLAMSQWEVIRDNFEDDHSRAFLMGTPWSMEPIQYPATGRSAYLSIRTRRPIPKGGSGRLTQALAAFIEAHNGVILTNKTVERLVIENGKCTGVECADGSTYLADKAVLSTMHIKHLVNMAPHELWGEDFIFGVDTWEGEISEVVAHYAVKEPPKYPIQGGAMISPAESAIVASPDRLLRFAYDDERDEPDLNDPPISVFCSTVADPTRAPAGMHTLKILGFHPYALKEGPEHWDAIKNKVSDVQLNYLRKFSPNLTDDKILGRFVESPLDLERRNPSFWRGSIHGGSSDLSQSGAMRPMPGWAQYRMPIPGLYQTGDTTYPGGSVTGAPGRNAAVVMLKDFGTSIEEVVAKKT